MFFIKSVVIEVLAATVIKTTFYYKEQFDSWYLSVMQADGSRFQQDKRRPKYKYKNMKIYYT